MIILYKGLYNSTAIFIVYGDIFTGAPASGPRYDLTGTLLPHSVLGRVEDYAMLSGQAQEVVYELITPCRIVSVYLYSNHFRPQKHYMWYDMLIEKSC